MLLVHFSQKKIAMQYSKIFDEWLLSLWAGFNIIVQGIGSKRNLLRKFMEQKLCEPAAGQDMQCSALVEINGYSPTVRHLTIVNTIIRDVLGEEHGTWVKHSDKVDYIIKHFMSPLKFAKRPYRLFLVVHNISMIYI